MITKQRELFMRVFERFFIFRWFLKIKRLYSLNKKLQYQLELVTDLYANISLERLTNNRKKVDLLVSLTSYSDRLDTVHLTILSLLNQTVTPEKLILWLADDEPAIDKLPSTLTDLIPFGLEIKYCADIRSYKKLIPTLELYPEKVIVTFDDDVIYPNSQLEMLYRAHLNSPTDVICHRAHRITRDKNGDILPYKLWAKDLSFSEKAIDLFPVGIGGVLYPPRSLHQDVYKRELFTELCPYADDIWFKVMACLNNTGTQLVSHPRHIDDYFQIPKTAQSGLWQYNLLNNDNQLKAVIKHYMIEI